MRGVLTLLMRSVRGDALKRQSHAFRIGSVIFVLILLFAAHADPLHVAAPGLHLFKSLSLLTMGLIGLAGMGHFATAITEEKEEGTLSLLLLAEISPAAILLGKSTSRILSAWLIFLAQFPFALLSLTLGGISVQQVVAAYVALGAYLFLVANLALLVSVVCRRTGKAIATMAVLLILLHAGVPSLASITRQLTLNGRLPSGSLIEMVVGRLALMHESTSILHAIQRIFDIRGTAGIVNWQVGMSLLGGLLLFGLAWIRFRQIVWIQETNQPQRGAVPIRASRWISLISRPWGNALAWKDFHFLTGGPTVMLVKVTLLPMWIALSLHYGSWIEMATGTPVVTFVQQSLLVMLVVELLIYSSQLFHVEQRWGTLPTLLMLPWTAAGIGYSKVAGCLLGSLPTFLYWLGLAVISEWGNGDGWQQFRQSAAGEEAIFALCGFLVLCQLTIYCSLIVKWGALPLAMGLLLIVGSLAAPFITVAMFIIESGHYDRLSQWGPILYVTGMVSALLQFEIGRRIQAVAGQ